MKQSTILVAGILGDWTMVTTGLWFCIRGIESGHTKI